MCSAKEHIFQLESELFKPEVRKSAKKMKGGSFSENLVLVIHSLTKDKL